jgi:hypothetical protein
LWWLECGLLVPNIFTVQFRQQFWSKYLVYCVWCNEGT